MNRTDLTDVLRQVLREELAPLLAHLDGAARTSDGRTPWSVHLDQWLAAQPVGLTGSAADLLPGFLASDPPPPPNGTTWTPVTFGRVLGHIQGAHLDGRVLRRRADRKGVYVYTVEAVPAPVVDAPPPEDIRTFVLQVTDATRARIATLRAASCPMAGRPPAFELPEVGPGRFVISAVVDVPGAVEVHAVEVTGLVDFLEALDARARLMPR